MKCEMFCDMLAEWLKQIRIGKKLSIYELSQMSGMSETQIRDIEAGRRNPTFGSLHLLAKAMGISVMNLIDVSDNSFYLNDDEKRFVELYRMLKPCFASLVFGFLRLLVEFQCKY